MKRRDWLDQLPPPPAPGTGNDAYQGWKEVMAAHAERAGVTWDPKEPELPERIEQIEDIYLMPAGDGIEGEDRPEIYREAAARYNAVQSIKEILPEGTETGSYVRAKNILDILDEEGVTRG